MSDQMSKEMERVDIDYLITGGAGFIGCALSTALIKNAGDKLPSIVAVDSLHPQVHVNSERPIALPASVDLRVFDVCDRAAWDALLQEIRPATIIHLAAETGTGQSLNLPTRHTHVNVTGTACMLEALDNAKVVPEHILLASSRAVYGEGCWLDPHTGDTFAPGNRSREQLLRGDFGFVGKSGRNAQPLPHDQSNTPANPTSVYGATKIAQEHVLNAWAIARGIPLSVMRLQNVYGVGQSPYNPYTGIVGLFHRIAAAGSAIEVYEDGQIGRDFVYIDDVVRSLLAAMEKPPTDIRIIDVGTGNVTTIDEVAHQIADMYGAPKPYISGAFRYGDIRWAVCSAQSLADNLGVVPDVDFRKGNIELSQWLHAIGVIGRSVNFNEVGAEN